MRSITLIKLASASVAAILAFSVSAPAQAPGLGFLDGLQKGQWVLKKRGSTETGQTVCLGDPSILLQIKHRSSDCTRFVIRDRPNSIRVSYKCGSADHGVTSIRRESSELVQIQSQGFEDGAPFSFSVEGRRSGAC